MTSLLVTLICNCFRQTRMQMCPFWFNIHQDFSTLPKWASVCAMVGLNYAYLGTLMVDRLPFGVWHLSGPWAVAASLLASTMCRVVDYLYPRAWERQFFQFVGVLRLRWLFLIFNPSNSSTIVSDHCTVSRQRNRDDGLCFVGIFVGTVQRTHQVFLCISKTYKHFSIPFTSTQSTRPHRGLVCLRASGFRSTPAGIPASAAPAGPGPAGFAAQTGFPARTRLR